jgi:citrate lyase subunit beta/citryl-CoA lyase
VLASGSLLFVPGDRPDRFEKAASSGADAVIIDLEDSVRPAAKAAARDAARTWLVAGGGRAWVRVNAATDEHHAADLEALAGAAGLLGVMLPKAEDPLAVDDLVRRIGEVAVLALVESAVGLLAAERLARHRAVKLLAFGNLDFAEDCGMTVSDPDEEELLYARSHLVVVSRAAGLGAPVDGVTADLRQLGAVRRDAARAARLGFGGKLCIHPSQVSEVHAAFAPTSEQVAWASTILGSVREGVGVVDGTMVDRPVILRAQRIMSLARTTSGPRAP